MCMKPQKTSSPQKPMILGLICIILLVTMTFAGCIGQEDRKILRIGHDREPSLLDPARLISASDHAIITNIYSYLIGFKPGTFEMIPDLCIEIPTLDNGLISPDGLIITFELRNDAIWHSGIQGTDYAGKDYGSVTAHDVVFTIERMKGLHNLTTDEIVYGAIFNNIEHVEAIDNFTVVFQLHQVDVGFLWALAPFRGGAIVNKQAIKDYGDDYFKNPIGS